MFRGYAFMQMSKIAPIRQISSCHSRWLLALFPKYRIKAGNFSPAHRMSCNTFTPRYPHYKFKISNIPIQESYIEFGIDLARFAPPFDARGIRRLNVCNFIFQTFQHFIRVVILYPAESSSLNTCRARALGPGVYQQNSLVWLADILSYDRCNQNVLNVKNRKETCVGNTKQMWPCRK